MNERSMFADGVLLLVVVFVLSRVLIEGKMKERVVAVLTVMRRVLRQITEALALM